MEKRRAGKTAKRVTVLVMGQVRIKFVARCTRAFQPCLFYTSFSRQANVSQLLAEASKDTTREGVGA